MFVFRYFNWLKWVVRGYHSDYIKQETIVLFWIISDIYQIWQLKMFVRLRDYKNLETTI
jgi:hypothetical protein